MKKKGGGSGSVSSSALKEKPEELQVKTGGHWFVKLLRGKGVEHIFGTTGAGMADIQDALTFEKSPKWIQSLHEYTTVCAAQGYGLAAEEPGVALIDRIVGTQNAIGALYAAYLNSAPVVVFASLNLPAIPNKPGDIASHFHSQQAELASAWTKWFTQINSLETMPADIDKAFFMASSEHQGPVYVTLRQDLMAQSASIGAPGSGFDSLLSPRVPDDATLSRIVEEIVSSEYPQIVVSHLGRHKKAVGSLVRFAHTFGIAVTERRFFINYPTDDPLHAGFLSRFFQPAIFEDADLVIAMELGLLPGQDFPRRVRVVDLSSDPFHRQDLCGGGDYGSSLFHADIRSACDLGPTLDKLSKLGEAQMTSSQKDRCSERFRRVERYHRKVYDEWREEGALNFERNVLNGWSIGHALNEHWSDDVTWVNGTSYTWDGLLKTIRMSEPGTYYGNASGHLGASPGMAYGVALARLRDQGQRRGYVVCTGGDGEAMFGSIDSALWTCSHYNIGVLYIIMNNACWGVNWSPIAKSSQHWARDSRDTQYVAIDAPKIEFAKIAEAFNVRAGKASTPKEFDSLLDEMVDYVRGGKPALIDLHMEFSESE